MLKSIPIQQFNPPEPPLFLQYFWVDFFANFKSRDLFVCLPQAVMGHSIFTFAPYRGKISNTFKTSMVQASLIEMASSRPAPCLKQSQHDCWLPNPTTRLFFSYWHETTQAASSVSCLMVTSESLVPSHLFIHPFIHSFIHSSKVPLTHRQLP